MALGPSSRTKVQVDQSFDMERLKDFAKKNPGNIKGTEAGDGTLKIYASKKGAGWFRSSRSRDKQSAGNQALNHALTASYGKHIAARVMAQMKNDLEAAGTYLTADKIEDADRLAASLAVSGRAGSPTSLAAMGAKADLPREAAPPVAFSDAGFGQASPPQGLHGNPQFGQGPSSHRSPDLAGEDDVDDLFNRPGPQESVPPAAADIIGAFDTSRTSGIAGEAEADDDDDIYDDGVAAQDGAPPTTGLDHEVAVDGDEEDEDDEDEHALYAKPNQGTTSVDGEDDPDGVTSDGTAPATGHPLTPPPVRPLDHLDLPDPPSTPILNTVVEWSLEDLPEPPKHAINHVATKSEESLAARNARLQAGRPRSATKLSNNHVQGILFAQRLTSNPEAFKALLKEAREKSGSHLLGDGGFRKTSGVDRFQAEAAIAKYFAKQPKPIAAMNGDERRALAFKAIEEYINLPDPSKKPVNG